MHISAGGLSWPGFIIAAACVALTGAVIAIAPVAGLLVVVLTLVWFGWASPGGLLLLTAMSVPTMALTGIGDTVLSRVTAFVILAVLLAVVTLVKGGLQELSTDPRLASLTWPLLGLVTLGAFTTVLSVITPDPRVRYAFPNSETGRLTVVVAQIGILALVAVLPLCSYRAMLVDTIRRRVMNLITGIGVVLAILSVGSFLLGGGHSQILDVSRPEVGAMSANAVGLILVVVMPIPLSRLMLRGGRRNRPVLVATCLVLALGAAITFSRITWVAELLAVFVVLLASARRVAVIFAMVSALLVSGMLVLFPEALSGVGRFFDPSRVYGIERLNIAQDAINIYMTHPIFGVGAGNYQFFDRSVPVSIVGAGVTHNQYLTVLAENGPLGVALLALFLVAVGRLIRQMLIAHRTDLREAALMLLGATVGMAVSGLAGDTFSISVSLAGGTIGLTVTAFYWIIVGAALAEARVHLDAPPLADRPPDRWLQTGRSAGDRGIPSDPRRAFGAAK